MKKRDSIVVPSDEEVAAAERAARGFANASEQARPAIEAQVEAVLAARRAAREANQHAYERFVGLRAGERRRPKRIIA